MMNRNPTRIDCQLRFALTALLAMAALMSAFAPRANAVSDAEELFTLSADKGSGAGQFGFMRQSAADPRTGHIYVADEANYRISELTPWGEFVKAFGWDVAPGSVNEQQEVRVRAAGGQFRLGFLGAETADLAFDAPGSISEGPNSVEAALNALPTIGGAGGNVTVSSVAGTADGTSPYVYVVAFKGSLAGADVTQLQISDGAIPLSGGQPTESQVLTRANGGPSGVGLEACTAESGCKSGVSGPRAGQFNPGALAVDPDGNLYLYDRFANQPRVQKFSSEGRFLLMIGGAVVSDGAAGSGDLSAGSTAVANVVTTSRFFEVGQAITGEGIPPGTVVAGVGPGAITLSKPASSSGAGVLLTSPAGNNNVPANTKQTIGIAPTQAGEVATGGTFTLTFETPNPSPSKETTAGLPREATAPEVEAGLGSLANLSPADIEVSGGAGGPWTIEFTGPRYGSSTPPNLILNPGGLTPPPSSPGIPYRVSLESDVAAEVCSDAASCRGASQGIANGAFNGGSMYRFSGGELAGGGETSGGLTVSGNSLFVGDNQRIQRFSLGGVSEAAFSTPGKTPRDLAAATSGDIYAYFYAETQVVPNIFRLSGSSGAQSGMLPISRTVSIASDTSGNIYAVNQVIHPSNAVFPETVLQFAPTFEPLAPATCCQSPPLPGATEFFEHYGVAGLSANSLGTLAITYTSPEAGQFLKVVGPSPASLEAPPMDPPAIRTQYAESVASSSAVVAATINPRFWSDTHYYVEYGTQPCSEGGCEQTLPVPPGNLLTDRSISRAIRTQSLALSDLQPGTTYHYRFVADSSGGGPVRGVGDDEAEGSFSTYPESPAPRTNCPNQAFRIGASAPLPDCRAYEMVSPVDKAGGDIFSLLNAIGYDNALSKSSTAGDKLTYSSYRAFADPKASPQTAQYIATRGANGWSTEAISPPRGNGGATVYGFRANFEPEYKAFSDDLCRGWLALAPEPQLAPGATDGYLNLYRRENCGSLGYEALIHATPTVIPELFETELQGTSADGSAAVIRVADKLTPDATGGGISQAYFADEGELHLLCILPDGEPGEVPCSGGTSPELDGGASNGGYSNHWASVSHAISKDGRRVYWTAADVVAPGAPTPTGGTGRIFLRVNPSAEQSADGSCDDPGKACTVAVSETKSSAPARFLGASADGATALFVFVDGTLKGNLYRFDAESGTSTLIAKKTRGVAGAGEDLEEVYFVSEEKLPGTVGALAGKPNLYLSSEGSNTFVATLSALDVRSSIGSAEFSPSNVDPIPVHHSAIASADGSTLAFTSDLPLTGYDNTDAKSDIPCGAKVGATDGLCDLEVYLYEAGADGPVCVSCNPSGAAPAGRAVEIVPSAGFSIPTAASLPLAKNQLYRPRILSAGGDRLFFHSYDPLSPRDTNGRRDVYEWRAATGAPDCAARGADVYAAASGGCLSLISGGGGSDDSEFLDASPSGENVFFSTEQSLLPQDPEQIDVYVARTGGGFAPPPSRPVPCAGEGCQQSAPAPPSSSVGSGSAGPGNPRQKCRKGTRRVERKGKWRCVKKPKRGAKSGKGAGR